MRFLLTSGGVTNTSIRNTLVELLGKPIEEASALYIPTALHANPRGPSLIPRLIRGEFGNPFSAIGWKSLSLLELTAIPSLQSDGWRTLVRETDALLVEGGDPLSLRAEAVYVGLSAGSMVLTPSIGEDFVNWRPANGGDETLGMVDFSIFPHLDHENLPDNRMENAEKWAAGMPVPVYLIDDQTAIKVVDGAAEVISEGHWKYVAR
jgi:dipeptidase E